jgi:DNA-binding XRE family transcriptional regulator
LREEIEAIRHELGETVAALAEKTDVTRQAKARIDRATQRIEHRQDQLRDALGIALAAAAAGFMIGRLTGGR